MTILKRWPQAQAELEAAATTCSRLATAFGHDDGGKIATSGRNRDDAKLRPGAAAKSRPLAVTVAILLAAATQWRRFCGRGSWVAASSIVSSRL